MNGVRRVAYDRIVKLEWNAGGWFGSLFGGTAWMGLGGALALRQDAVAGGIALGLFTAVVALGVGLWCQRDRRSPLRSIQLLIVTIGLAGAATIFALDGAGIWEAIQMSPRIAAGPSYGILAAVCAALLLLFHLRFD